MTATHVLGVGGGSEHVKSEAMGTALGLSPDPAGQMPGGQSQDPGGQGANPQIPQARGRIPGSRRLWVTRPAGTHNFTSETGCRWPTLRRKLS